MPNRKVWINRQQEYELFERCAYDPNQCQWRFIDKRKLIFFFTDHSWYCHLFCQPALAFVCKNKAVRVFFFVKCKFWIELISHSHWIALNSCKITIRCPRSCEAKSLSFLKDNLFNNFYYSKQFPFLVSFGFMCTSLRSIYGHKRTTTSDLLNIINLMCKKKN